MYCKNEHFVCFKVPVHFILDIYLSLILEHSLWVIKYVEMKIR